MTIAAGDYENPCFGGGYDEEGPIMAKGQRRTSREARKPKKDGPPKQNASNPSLKGMPASPSPSPSVKKG